MTIGSELDNVLISNTSNISINTKNIGELFERIVMLENKEEEKEEDDLDADKGLFIFDMGMAYDEAILNKSQAPILLFEPVQALIKKWSKDINIEIRWHQLGEKDGTT